MSEKDSSFVTVALKILNNSQDISDDFLREITNQNLLVSDMGYVVPCYGISQDPETNNYVIVMEYV
jgi:hypothetical protein